MRAKEEFSGQASATRAAARISADLLPDGPRAPTASTRPTGTVQGLAVIVDKKGDALGSNGQGAPTLGFAASTTAT